MADSHKPQNSNTHKHFSNFVNHNNQEKHKTFDQANDQHVMMFPFFAFGHVSPFAQLSNKLTSHRIRITFLTTPGFVPKVKALIKPSSKSKIIALEISPSLGLPRDLAGTNDLLPSEASKLIPAIDLTQPQVETLISELKPDLVVFDFAQCWIPSLAAKYGVKTMYFSVVSAIALSYFIGSEKYIRGKGINPIVDDYIKPPPGFPSLSDENPHILKSFEAKGLLYAYEIPEDGTKSLPVRSNEGLEGCSALIIKSCHELEGPYLKFLKTCLKKPFLLTGPLIPEKKTKPSMFEEKITSWLDRFSPNSVVFCSFGSETFLDREKIKELALGLELTGLPFFLVLNFPKNVDAKAELEAALPLGFRERTKDVGLIHVGWVPQQLILGHFNVGCYLSHAGLSSLIEALVNDCQLVLLPQKFDQFFNSRLLNENGMLRVGVEVNTRDEDGYFERKNICEAVKTVMIDVDQEPGKSIRVNQKKLHDFLQDKETQDKFILNMVKEMKRIILDT